MASRSVLKFVLPVALCLLTGYLLLGHKKYGPVRESAYDFAGAIYSSCNRKDATQLPTLVEMVATAEEAQNISAGEARTLQGLVAIAQSGDWSTAASEARQLMRAQVQIP